MNSLVLQNTYEYVACALAINGIVTTSRIIDKKDASALLIPTIRELLAESNLSLSDLSHIIVNQGPAPFTTLRTVIATANGLAFATGIPLIGVDGLRAFYEEYRDDCFPQTIILLNAFNHDVYYALLRQGSGGQAIHTGYQNARHFLESLASLPGPIRFLGAGVPLYQTQIVEILGDRTIIPTPLPTACSIQAVATYGLNQLQKTKATSTELMPLYLKKFDMPS